MKRILTVLIMVLCLGGWAAPGFAHKPSDSYLKLAVTGHQINGQWDIALRDLDYAIGLDSNDDGAITWGELRGRRQAVDAYALARLRLENAGSVCAARPTALQVDSHTDGAYAVLRFEAVCPQAPTAIDIRYSLLFDLDPQHRGLLNLEAEGRTRTAIFSPEAAEQHLELAGANPFLQFLDFVREGIWHIWIGFDHILFLLTLLLPAVLERVDGRWQPTKDLKTVFANVLKVVTAFTVAHSLTLSLASLGVISLPSRPVESAIALSVVLAALNNLFPLVRERRWTIAFLFGLIHGFGFASVLADLGLPRGSLLLALVGFNLGVEVGQVAIVLAFVPFAFFLRRSWFYRQPIFTGGSAMIAAIAAVWLAERVFDFKVLMF